MPLRAMTATLLLALWAVLLAPGSAFAQGKFVAARDQAAISMRAKSQPLLEKLLAEVLLRTFEKGTALK
jgi:hypothetical protein